MSNMAAYHAFAGHDPQNRFQLNLDFSKPPLIDTINPVSAPTPNVSSLSIEGDRDAWLAVIQEAVVGVIENRRNRRTWLHRALIYDYGLFFLGAPAALYACWRVSGPIERFLGSIHTFLSAAAYLYIFALVVAIYRIFFGYTKWAFPSVELDESRDSAKLHRRFWYPIAIALVGNLIWDIFR